MTLSDKKTEAEARAKYIDLKLDDARWPREYWLLEREITPGKILPQVNGGKRIETSKLKPDYVLQYEPDNYIAVVEAKSTYKEPADGLQQAIDYAKLLKVNFAYATNGHGIIEYDFIKDQRTEIDRFPTPEELWNRQNEKFGFDEKQKQDYLIPLNKESDDPSGDPIRPRYYQLNAINTAMQKILHGENRLLLSLATGTGKTFIAFQIAWKLWKANPGVKILFLVDRTALVKQAMNGSFKPFGDKMCRIQKKANTARIMYFTLYQALDVTKEDTQLYEQYPNDFFDYVIVDECHRGVSSEESKWREILDYYSSATHIGMTATPSRKNTLDDTYRHFNEPIYQYSLQQGIKDGFLAPFVVTTEVLDIDIEGYLPQPEDVDLEGNPLTKKCYYRDNFDQVLTVKKRQEEIADRITEFMKKEGKFNKTIVFCQNSRHALAMVQLLSNRAKEGPDYCVRITSNEKGHDDYLDNFQNTKEKFPVIAVTSRLMSTGIDAPTCRNIILDKTLRSMIEFKQIIGRGTRVSEFHDKYWFNILDFRDCTALFLDPDWDGPPSEPPLPPTNGGPEGPISPRPPHAIVDGREVRVIGRKVSIYDPASGGESLLSYEEYTGNVVKRLESDFAKELKEIWINVENRQQFVDRLESRGISITYIRQLMENYDADVFDILYHLAHGSKIKTRKQRADKLKTRKSFLEKYPDKAREVLSIIMDLYAEVGYQEINPENPAILKLKEFEKFGGDYVIKNKIFNGIDDYKKAIMEVLQALYEA